MSNVARVAGQAANTTGKPLSVENVFSTYLYEGNSSTQTITNGIDLSGEGGLTWFKCRNVAMLHNLFDTERGETQRLDTSTSNAQSAQATGRYPTFTSTGFTLGNDTGGDINYTGRDYASWTFRKAPKFFDVVTYTGTGSAQNISHNLGSVPGCIIVKSTSAATNWKVFHRGLDATNPSHKWLEFDAGAVADTTVVWNDTEPTSTEFTVGTEYDVNGSGVSYVAYLFAHNDGDGDFGPDGNADIIKCGSYTGNGSLSGPTVDLGFEPQWIIIKNATQTQDWEIFDVMRGWTSDGNSDQRLEANNSNAEITTGSSLLKPTATGFALTTTNSGLNQQNETFIYIAIRRGPMAVPESATEVFAPVDDLAAGDRSSGFTTDAYLWKRTDNTNDWRFGSRLTGSKVLNTNSTASETDLSSNLSWDQMDGVYAFSENTPNINYFWKRAPNFFDAVAYTGNGTAGRTVSHNLGVAPEMMWVKKRAGGTGAWPVYHVGAHSTSPENYFLQLNSTITATLNSARWNNTAPTATEFTVGDGGTVNDPSDTYIAYLFASLDGVSKVGSFTGNGSSQDIDCGFSSGARFVLLKRTDSSGTWFILDTERGIVAGNDAILRPNSTVAEDNSYDIIDPLSSGFTINFVDAYNMNTSGATYIFYAIA